LTRIEGNSAMPEHPRRLVGAIPRWLDPLVQILKLNIEAYARGAIPI